MGSADAVVSRGTPRDSHLLRLKLPFGKRCPDVVFTREKRQRQTRLPGVVPEPVIHTGTRVTGVITDPLPPMPTTYRAESRIEKGDDKPTCHDKPAVNKPRHDQSRQ